MMKGVFLRALAGRQGRDENGELRNSFQSCGTKNKGPARRISCKPLICLVPEPGIGPGRPYERGILSPLNSFKCFWCCLPGRASGEVRKASVTFRVTSLLVVQQRWASLQRAPRAGVPYLLALSKPSLNGVLGVECSNHSVPTI